LINPDGSDPVRLTSDGFDDRLPAWSPDSQRIAFSKSNGGAMHTINRNGTNLESVLPLAAWPAWSPDGLRLAFVQNDPTNNNRGTVFIAKPDGTDKIKVTNNPNGARAPSWAPDSSAPIPTFTISGHVTDPNGAPVSGASLTMFTERLLTTQSDSTGAYSFTGLSAGTYRIDASKPGHGFIPPSITLTNITSNQTADFTAFLAFSISGQVSISGSTGAGIPVTLSGSQSLTVFTEVGGVYSFNVLPAGGNYTVSINSPFFIATPASITFNNLQANQVANFDAVIAKFTISGTTRRLGLPKPGITVRLRNTSGNEPLSTITDANGHYAFTNVSGGPYSVELASANYLADSKGIPAMDSDKIVDFDLRSANHLVLSSATFTVLEGKPTLQISVFRGGNADGVGPITVDYATADGTAKAGLDYTAVTGTLDFPEGAFSRIITIPILDDQDFEGPEEFSLTLSNPTGEVDLTTVNSAVVTIADNEIRLITEANSDRAIALNTMSMVGEPFSLTTEPNFSVDQRSRISLFVEDLRVNQTFPTIIVEAVDAQQNHFQLPLEVVGFSLSFPFQQLVVRLPENLSTGELVVTITVNGRQTNAARISIKP
jgi:protocatechuate 3,4-dioxygenase beta subunit